MFSVLLFGQSTPQPLVVAKKQPGEKKPHPPRFIIPNIYIDYECPSLYNTDIMKKYNISRAAKELGVARQTIYNWIERGWVTPKRDYKGHSVFTDADLKKIKEWMNKLDEV